MTVPTPVDGFFAAGTEATANRLNWLALQAGAIGSRPTADADINGAKYLSTDEVPMKLYEVQSGSWVQIAIVPDDRYIRKASAENVTSSTTLQNDDELVLAVGANEKWIVHLKIYVQAGMAAGGFKWTFTLPTGMTANYESHKIYDNAATPGSGAVLYDHEIGQVATTTFSVSAGVLTAGTMVVEIELDLEVGANAGNVQFQWAQNGSSGTSTSVYLGSYLIARRVA